MKNILAKNKILLLVFGVILVSTPFIIGAATCPEGSYQFETGIPLIPGAGKGECLAPSGLSNLLISLIKLLFPIAGILAFVMIVVAGFEYAASGGDTNKQKDAQDRIVNAIIGLVLLFAFWLILNTINPDLLRVQDLSLEPIGSNVLEKLPEEYIKTQQDILNKLRAPAVSFLMAVQINGQKYVETEGFTKINIVDKTDYDPVRLYLKALTNTGITNPKTDFHHGASCDYYIAAVMRISGLDHSYPSTLSEQYPYILSNPLYKCISGTKGNYLQKDQAPNGSILFYDTDGDGEVEHTALWLDGKRLQASAADPEFYPMDRGTAFNGPNFQVLTICQYKG